MLKLNAVTAGYGKTPVINGVSLCVKTGTLTGILGANGSGKTTLLKAMLGILPLQSGQLTLDGQDLSSLPRQQLAKRIAYLSQGRATPDMSVEQLVLHGRFPHLRYPRRYSPADRAVAYAAMEQVGIAQLAPLPLHTLSGGLRQTAYIAMALAQDTDYILLDEPTTYLDISHQLQLLRLLQTLAAQGKGVVTVMHDLPMAFTFSQQLTVLRHGAVAAQGTPEQLCRLGVPEQVFGVTLLRDDRSDAYHLQLNK